MTRSQKPQSLPDELLRRLEAVLTSGSKAEKYQRAKAVLRAYYFTTESTGVNDSVSEYLPLDIAELLEANGILRMSDLGKINQADLLSIPQFGQRSIEACAGAYEKFVRDCAGGKQS